MPVPQMQFDPVPLRVNQGYPPDDFGQAAPSHSEGVMSPSRGPPEVHWQIAAPAAALGGRCIQAVSARVRSPASPEPRSPALSSVTVRAEVTII
jgi:hypothetical protein